MNMCGSWALAGALAGIIGSGCGGTAHPPLPSLPDSMDSLDPRVASLLVEADAALREAPEDAERWRRLGLGLEAHGLSDEAVVAYEGALALRPESPRLWYRLAAARELADDRQGAVEAMERVLSLEEGYAPAHWRLGYWRLEEGDHPAARSCFGEALRVDPSSEPAALGLVEVHLAAGEPGPAASGLVGTSLLEGRNGPHALRLLGIALQRSGGGEEAEALLATYRKAQPAFRDPWSEEGHGHERGMATINRRARTLIADGRALDAVRLLEGARAEEPEHVIILRTLGAAYSAVGRARDARDVLREASRLDPANLELRVDAAWAGAMYGDLEQALEEAAAILSLDAGFHKAHTLRTRILIDRGRQAEAVEAFAAALEHGAQEPDVAVDVGKTLLELGRLEEAAEMFALVTAQDPGRLPGWIGLALTALERGELEEAGRALERARALHGLRRDAGDGPILEVLEARLEELRGEGR